MKRTGTMMTGHPVIYLGVLSQQGYTIHMWKLSYVNGRDDSLAKLVLSRGK